MQGCICEYSTATCLAFVLRLAIGRQTAMAVEYRLLVFGVGVQAGAECRMIGGMVGLMGCRGLVHGHFW